MADYSELEVAPTDRAAHAPEVDLSSQSPELSKKQWPTSLSSAHSSTRPPIFRKNSRDAPETAALDGRFPQDYDRDGEGLKEAAPGYPGSPMPTQPDEAHSTENEQTQNQRQRRPRRWIFVGLVTIIILGVALGVGLGVGLTRHKNSNQSSNTTALAPASGVLPHGLRNGTSMAAVSLSTGDKRFFFQDNSGAIREALYTSSAKLWTANPTNIVAANARYSTPMAALLVNSTTTSGTNANVIYLFYISAGGQLASSIFTSGTWTTRDNFSPGQESNITYNTAPNTEALAITIDTNSTSSGKAFVFYVAQNGSAQCLSVTSDNDNGIIANPGPPLPSGVQGGHILGLAAGDSSAGGHIRPQVGVLTSNGTVYYNLFFSFFTNGAWSLPQLQTVLVPPLPAAEQPAVPTSLTLANAYPAAQTSVVPLPTDISTPSEQSAIYNESLLGNVNIAQVFLPTSGAQSNEYTLFGFWVNGTSLAAYTTSNIGLSGMPQSEFPFTRLAATSGGGGTGGGGGSGEVFLYHQINQTSVAEDVYNSDRGFFSTSYFDIGT